MGRTISISNQKGGTGKTTSAVNLATCISLAGKSVLLIDNDPQGNATSGVGVDKRGFTNSIYHVILGQIPVNQAIIQTKITNLSLVPSNQDLTGAEVELVGAFGREYKLKKALEAIKGDFDFILLDCPPSLGLLTINSLTASDSALIPIQCEYYALEGLSQLLNVINLVKENLNSDLEVEGVVLTMADYRTNLTKEVIQEVRSFFKEKVYKTIIPRSISLSEAPGFGKPILLYKKDSIGARMYDQLSREVMGEIVPEVAEDLLKAEIAKEGATPPEDGTSLPDERTAPPEERTAPPDERTAPPEEGTAPPAIEGQSLEEQPLKEDL